MCCDQHLNRYVPVGENTVEGEAVRSALARWREHFYLPGEDENDGRVSVEDIPAYVAALIPEYDNESEDE